MAPLLRACGLRAGSLVVACALLAPSVSPGQAILPRVRAMAAGDLHTCALVGLGTVKCWGWGPRGSWVDSGNAQIAPLPAPATAVVAGGDHTCAIVADGLYCWGLNTSGELGNGTLEFQTDPVQVLGLARGVTAASIGIDHACAVVNGSAWCWGANESGQLGTGIEGDAATTPQRVVGLEAGVTDISVGWGFSCAAVNGAAKCWGGNWAGSLGDGTVRDSAVPVQVSGLRSGVTKIAAGGFGACAVVDGSLRCWAGFVPPATGPGSTPETVRGLEHSVVNVALGSDHACAVTSDRALHCWGENQYGEIGSGNFEPASEPVTVALDGTNSDTLAVGLFHTCIARHGHAYCWGSNTTGALGIADTPPYWSTQPLDVPNLPSSVQFVGAGTQSACAIAAGDLYCWGANNNGQLGDGSVLPHGAPAPVSNLHGVQAVAPSWFHTCALADGDAYCWGSNYIGQLGDGSTDDRRTPVRVDLPHGVASIATGLNHSCAVVSGLVKCWGAGDMLGRGGNLYFETRPASVIGIYSGAALAAAGYEHTCALISGTVKCWGRNSEGQLGNGSNADALTPVAVVGLPAGVTGLAAGGSTTCAIAAGGAWCWGAGTTGQLGDGRGENSNVPVPVIDLDAGVLALTVATWHACALTTAGMKCWGNNSLGQLGAYSGDSVSYRPVASDAFPPDVSAVAAGSESTCVVAGERLLCVGGNNSAELGVGGKPWWPLPLPVAAIDDGWTHSPHAQASGSAAH